MFGDNRYRPPRMSAAEKIQRLVEESYTPPNWLQSAIEAETAPHEIRTGSDRQQVLQTSITVPDFQHAFDGIGDSVQAAAHDILTVLGGRVIEYLQSYTEELTPTNRVSGLNGEIIYVPVEILRYEHPGGWGDITGELVESYFTSVLIDPGTGNAQLIIGNTSRHAIYVEAKDGMFVISGILEEGGPVMTLLKQVVQEILPAWEITGGGAGGGFLQPPLKQGQTREKGLQRVGRKIDRQKGKITSSQRDRLGHQPGPQPGRRPLGGNDMMTKSPYDKKTSTGYPTKLKGHDAHTLDDAHWKSILNDPSFSGEQ